MTDTRADLSRPEIQLLLKCVRRSLPEVDRAEVRRILTGALDWDLVLHQAHRHAVLPLLRRGLDANFRGEAPPAVLATLRAACRHAQQRNLALTAELLHVLMLLERSGIGAVPFKGPLVALEAYGDLSLRTFADLDILLGESDLAAAKGVLEAAGYIPEYKFTAPQERAYRKMECALSLAHSRRDVRVELHWGLTERYLSIALPVKEFWRRSVPATLAGRKVPTFAREDLLLYLCVHGSKHRWERLEWLCSIAELAIRSPRLDWPAVRRNAREAGVDRFLNVSLLMARELTGLELPESVRRDAEADQAARELARELAAEMFRPARQTSEDGRRGNWYFYLLRSRERRADRARMVFYSCLRLPHPSARELVRLPERLWFLYYLLRPARLFRASARALWRNCLKKPAPKQGDPLCTD